jgi:hypothetical protein
MEETIEVKLPKALTSKLDELEKKELSLSLQAENYLYEEWEQKLRRIKKCV